MNDTLIIEHNAGFFSCCSIRLSHIINFFNNNKRLPNRVDSSNQFSFYKVHPHDTSSDLTKIFFEEFCDFNFHYETEIKYHHNWQFNDFRTLDVLSIKPFIKKYFTPSKYIIQIAKNFEQEYDINFEKTIVVFYRGTDKAKETKIASYDVFIEKAKEILKNNPNYKFLLQTDETEFLDLFYKNFPNSFHIKKIPQGNKNNQVCVDRIVQGSDKFDLACNFFATILLMAKCSNIITHSGNGSSWIHLYRGNSDNMYQFLDDKFLI
jgi:hypothetical protein